MKSLNLLSFDQLQTMLYRIDTHRRTVNELDYTREDIIEELNSRVDEIVDMPDHYHSRVCYFR